MVKKKRSKGKGKASAFRKKYNKEAMIKRTKEAYDSREASGKYSDYFSDDMPLEKKKLKTGDHVMDIIPYLAGDNNPSVSVDEPTYKLDIWVHTNIGPKEGMYVCPARNYDKPCPICEEVARLRREEDSSDSVDNTEMIKALNPKRRCAYNIMCYDSAKDEEIGVQLLEVSHYLFETELNAVSKNKRTGGFVPFSDPDIGKTVEFTKEGAKKLMKFKGFQLTDREEPVTDEMLDQAICIEDYINILSYDELAKVSGLKTRRVKKEPEEEEYEEEPEEEEYEEEPEEEEEEEYEEELKEEEDEDIPFNEGADEEEPEEPEEESAPKKSKSRLRRAKAQSTESSKPVKTTRRRRRR